MANGSMKDREAYSHHRWKGEYFRSHSSGPISATLYREQFLGGQKIFFSHKSDVFYGSNSSFKEMSKNIILPSLGLIIQFGKPLFTYTE